MTATRKATTIERKLLYGLLRIAGSSGILLHKGHRLTTAAREFEAEGLVRIEDVLDSFDVECLRLVVIGKPLPYHGR